MTKRGLPDGGEDYKKVAQPTKNKRYLDSDDEAAVPIGPVVGFSGEGTSRTRHYKSFNFKGAAYKLRDTVLLLPNVTTAKPYVARIKEITQDAVGDLMITAQWFYRPEEALGNNGQTFTTQDPRELFYSFHLDQVSAESVMHKCVVHFVPLHKQLPLRSEHPGFIAQMIYDIELRKLYRLTDRDYEDDKQLEIDMLVQQTQERLKLPDIYPKAAALIPIRKPEDISVYNDDKLKSSKKVLLPFVEARADRSKKPEKLGIFIKDVGNKHQILREYRVLTGDVQRDKWLEKLFQRVEQVCNSKEFVTTQIKDKRYAVSLNPKATEDDGGVGAMGSKHNGSNAGKIWGRDAIIPVIAELEMSVFGALGEFQKYNQKMRQLDFNLKSNPLLVSRLLSKELDPVAIVAMSAQELKDGFVIDKKTDGPENLEKLQMTNARCVICKKKKVGVADIIQTGGQGDRYRLECQACFHQWFSTRDAIATFADEPEVPAAEHDEPWEDDDVVKKPI